MTQAMIENQPQILENRNEELQSYTIAIVDDAQEERTLKRYEIEDAGFRAYIVSGVFGDNREALIQEIMNNSSAAICDHSLLVGKMASFSGAALVEELYKRNFPAVLVTLYWDIDASDSIRRHRRYIPEVLSNNEFGPKLREAIQVCRDEINGRYRLSRKAGRTILRVERTNRQSNELYVDAIVPSWHPKQAVRFPASMIELSELRNNLFNGKHLFAKVNTSAQKPEDLFFYDFEDALVPPEDFLE